MAPSAFLVETDPAVMERSSKAWESAGIFFRVRLVQAGSFSAGSAEPADDAKVPPLLLRQRQVAEALEVSESTVKRLVADGRLPVVRVNGATRIRVADLAALVEGLPSQS